MAALNSTLEVFLNQIDDKTVFHILIISLIFIFIMLTLFQAHIFFRKRKGLIPFNREIAAKRYPQIFTDQYLGNPDEALSALLPSVFDKIRKPKDLDKKQHFYLVLDSLLVSMPSHLRKKHPKKLTIVLLNSFEIVEVTKYSFTVELFINYKKERLVVSFSAVQVFADPPIGFALRRTTI